MIFVWHTTQLFPNKHLNNTWANIIAKICMSDQWAWFHTCFLSYVQFQSLHYSEISKEVKTVFYFNSLCNIMKVNIPDFVFPLNVTSMNPVTGGEAAADLVTFMTPDPPPFFKVKVTALLGLFGLPDVTCQHREIDINYLLFLIVHIM